MKLYFIFGLPGAGKGICAQKLKLQKSFIHFSLGDFLREQVRNKTEIGLQNTEKIMSGLVLLDCQLVSNLVKDRITYAFKQFNDIVIDGFPRTINQLNMIQDFLDLNNISPKWIYFQINYETAILRLLNRKHCSKCSYDYIFEQLKSENLCNYCGSLLIQRITDNKKDIVKRCDFFYSTTYKVIEILEKKGILITLKSDGDLEYFSQEFLQHF